MPIKKRFHPPDNLPLLQGFEILVDNSIFGWKVTLLRNGEVAEERSGDHSMFEMAFSESEPIKLCFSVPGHQAQITMSLDSATCTWVPA